MGVWVFVREPRLKPSSVALLAILCLTLLIRVGFFVAGERLEKVRKFGPDGWLQTASHVADGNGYSWPHKDQPTARRGPTVVLLFAGVLALFGGESPWPILFLQWISDLGTVFLLYQMGKMIFGSARVGLLSGLGYGLYAPSIGLSCQAFSEPISTFLVLVFCVAFLIAIKRGSLGLVATAGVVLGLLVLARPVFCLFPLVAVFFLGSFSFSSKRWKARALFFLSFVLVLLPWTARNYGVFGAFIPTTTHLGLPLYQSHFRLAEPDYQRYRLAFEAHHALEEELSRRYGPAPEGGDFWSQSENRGIDEYRLEQVAREEAVTLILDHPARYAWLCVVRSCWLWFNIGLPAPAQWESVVVSVQNGFLLLLASLAFVFRSRNGSGRGVQLLVLLIGYNCFFYAAAHAVPRFSVPIVPCLMLFAGFSVNEMVVRWRRSRPPFIPGIESESASPHS